MRNPSWRPWPPALHSVPWDPGASEPFAESTLSEEGTVGRAAGWNQGREPRACLWVTRTRTSTLSFCVSVSPPLFRGDMGLVARDNSGTLVLRKQSGDTLSH